MSKLTLAADNKNRCHDQKQSEVAPSSNTHINNDRACNFLTMLATALKIKVCFVDRLDFYGEKANGLYNGNKNGRRMIYIDKNLKGRKLQFVLAHELGHAVLHAGKLGQRYRKDFDYRNKLETEADDFALKMLKPWWSKKDSYTSSVM